ALMFLESNRAHPTLIKCMSILRQYQLPAADAVYHIANLHGDYSYRLTGHRGSARCFQLTTWKGSCANHEGYAMVAEHDNLTNPEMLGDNQEIDIVLSATPHEGHWIALPEGDCEIWVRQYYCDWETEEPATQMKIERIGGSYPPPPLTRAELEANLQLTQDWLHFQSDYFLAKVREHLQTDPGTLAIVSHPTAWQSNQYLSGHYRCQQDEAVIIEFDAPQAYYWGMQLANLQWEAMEYYMRHSSLNNKQAHIDDDGKVRIVISHTDPGVVNWFDTSGRTLGLISARYFKCPEAAPPVLRNVLLKDLRQHLPDNTPVVTLQQRQGLIQSRLASVFRRLAADQ
ncbi:MAG: DUF1214 domain-containing protein, partial [Pseudomonadota bacterium]